MPSAVRLRRLSVKGSCAPPGTRKHSPQHKCAHEAEPDDVHGAGEEHQRGAQAGAEPEARVPRPCTERGADGGHEVVHDVQRGRPVEPLGDMLGGENTLAQGR